MGDILFGGAQYSLREQANLTLIFFPKIVGERGGGHQKLFSGHTPKKFSGHTYKHSTKFSRHSKKNSRNIFSQRQNFFYDKSKFFRNLYVLPEFCSDFCPTVKIWGGGTCPPPRPIRLCFCNKICCQTSMFINSRIATIGKYCDVPVYSGKMS